LNCAPHLSDQRVVQVTDSKVGGLRHPTYITLTNLPSKYHDQRIADTD